MMSPEETAKYKRQMKIRVIILNPMQSPPGVWLSVDAKTGKQSVAHQREVASVFSSKDSAQMRAQMFAQNYKTRGNETLAFVYMESED